MGGENGDGKIFFKNPEADLCRCYMNNFDSDIASVLIIAENILEQDV